MPTYSNPLGSVMPDENKARLVALCEARGVALIEDDIYGEISFASTRPLPMKAWDKRGSVMYCSSFSKTLAPGMRVGWCAPGRHIEGVAIAKRAASGFTAHASQLAIASDYEFFERPEWKALRAAYGLNFHSQRTMQPDFMYQAAAAGDADVVSAYTSDGRIAKYDLKVLSDPKQAIPPYDAIVLLAPKRAGDEQLAAALKPLIEAIDVEVMREANLRASGGDTTPDVVARWMWGEIEKK